MKAQYGIAVDQYGSMLRYGKHPRKDLCEQVGRKRAQKMYVDKKSGGRFHVGYVIGGRWFTLYAPVEVQS